MPDKPASEIVIDEPLVRRLLVQAATRIPDALTAPLQLVDEGWDCAVWRLGVHHAVRVPRRAVAAPLLAHEARGLAHVGPAVERSGVRVPTPVFTGRPTHGCPWNWSVVPWIAGVSALRTPTHARSAWAPTLARALRALHVPAPGDHPVNPYRGVPLQDRDRAIRARLDAAAMPARQRDRLRDAWCAGIGAPAWHGRAVWIHGDLHPGNLIVDAGRLSGIIDFGDVTAGDPAYDLAIAWLGFDAEGRRRFIAATEDAYDAWTWVRARAWAAAVAVTLREGSDDDSLYGELGRRAVLELSADDE